LRRGMGGSKISIVPSMRGLSSPQGPPYGFGKGSIRRRRRDIKAGLMTNSDAQQGGGNSCRRKSLPEFSRWRGQKLPGARRPSLKVRREMKTWAEKGTTEGAGVLSSPCGLRVRRTLQGGFLKGRRNRTSMGVGRCLKPKHLGEPISQTDRAFRQREKG